MPGAGGTTAAFSSVEEQRAHFRSDWHRFNVRRKLHGRPVFTEEEFERSVQDDGELSSISGSDSDSENDSDTARLGSHAATSTSHRSAEVIFVSGGQIFKVWRALLHPDLRHEELDKALLAERLLRLRQEKGHWVVLLSRGGHFAATIFNVSIARPSGQGKHETPPYEVVMHKTFHRYVVRAKAGGRQSAKDATGKSIKSAGSALRRHNEAALERDIQDTLQAWKARLQGAALIFVHAPSSNAAALFGGEHPVLDRADLRIRSVPFTTRRPTFAETKRVVTVLLSVQSAELPPMLPADIIQPRAKAAKESPQKGKTAEPAVMEPPAAPAIPDSPLHLAAKAGIAEKVAQLLQKGEDPTVLDARGKPPYSVAADKEVRDAFRRYMASEDALQWDWTAAGVPSALTPEMEAQQAARQAEKKAKMREREKERKKRAAERKSKAAEESRAAAEAEVSIAAAEAAALATRRETGASGKVKLSKGEAAAAQKREQMAAAAEARMARLQLLSQQQQLW
ncbi:g265 [Coccomyxa elongata]